jgi:hypothetical protein
MHERSLSPELTGVARTCDEGADESLRFVRDHSEVEPADKEDARYVLSEDDDTNS